MARVLCLLFLGLILQAVDCARIERAGPEESVDFEQTKDLIAKAIIPYWLNKVPGKKSKGGKKSDEDAVQLIVQNGLLVIEHLKEIKYQSPVYAHFVDLTEKWAEAVVEQAKSEMEGVGSKKSKGGKKGLGSLAGSLIKIVGPPVASWLIDKVGGKKSKGGKKGVLSDLKELKDDLKELKEVFTDENGVIHGTEYWLDVMTSGHR